MVLKKLSFRYIIKQKNSIKAVDIPNKLTISGKFLIKGDKNSGVWYAKFEVRRKNAVFQANDPQPTKISLVRKPQKIENRIREAIEIDIKMKLSLETKNVLKAFVFKKNTKTSKRIE